MGVLRTGVDLIEVERIREAVARHGERFFTRVFTTGERNDCGMRMESLAARFAAKEAAAKALGCGIGDVGWQEIEICLDERKAPYLVLHGEAKRISDELGLTTWSVSLSHTQNQAIAFVVAMSG